MNEFMFWLKGTMPLLMHADDILAADRLKEERMRLKEKNLSVKGDDRSPAWTWQEYCYSDGVHLAIPQECIMAALRYAGARLPTGKGQGTYKAISQSGLLIGSDYCEFRCHGEQIAIADIRSFRDEPFASHIGKVQDLGFELHVKRAKIAQSKNIRVRPIFKDWSVQGSIHVSDEAITPDVLGRMFEIAGTYAGLCDWRPSSKTPGPFGTFTSTVQPLKAGRKAS